MEALIAPTEFGYNLAEIKRAALSYDKIYLLDQGDRDLFPGIALSYAIGLPPLIAASGGRRMRPLGKVTDYDARFEALLTHLHPLQEAGVVEVTSCWDRNKADNKGLITIGSIPLGGYQLEIRAVLAYYRMLARDNGLLEASLDRTAVSLAESEDAAFISEQGQVDGSINDDPALPLLEGPLLNEELRNMLTVIARSRIATALKVWGVAEQRGLIPVLPKPSALVLDRVASSARAAIDSVEADPYWARRTAFSTSSSASTCLMKRSTA